MDLSLRGRTALVSGSTAGIGRAIAEGLMAAGAQVVVSGRTQGRVDEAVAALRARVSGAHVTGVAADLSTAEGANALIARVPQVDVLVNNLGIFEPKPFAEIDDADWMRR